MKQLVIMPGGFHPFHAGHLTLYQYAQQEFPGADVKVAATNDTSNRPFPFKLKEKLAQLAGVSPGDFYQVKSPFQALEITQKYNPADTQLIFIRSEKDANKPPLPGKIKKDGTPGYLQLVSDQMAPMTQHAYMAYGPTEEFGPGMTSATEIRDAWPTLNEKRKTALVMILYPKTQKNPRLAATVVKMLDTAMGSEQAVAESNLNEYRDQLWTWIQSKFPRTQWPEYVQRDFLYAKAKGNKNQKDLEDFLNEIQQDFGNCKWTLTKIPITLDIFTPKTQRMIQSREGGSSNPFQVPKDAERHALQSQMIQQKGVSAEPIIVAKLANGYDLIEGWHRTIQHLKAFPQGYTGPAWVCTGATYKSESVEQCVAEGFPQPGPSSGAPKQFGSDAKIQTRQMTVKDIISSVPGVPYYNNVVDDWDSKDYSWGVTKKVIEYATYLKDHPESLAKLPPAIVLNGKFEDGAHRVSAIWLLQQRMDPKNPLWKNAKLNVQFVKQGVAEGLDEAVGGNYLYHATGADGLKGMLSSGSISKAKGPQKATQAQTEMPTVSVTRDWGYASGAGATQQSFGGLGRDAVIVLDRNAIESNFKTLGTSQSHDIRGLPRVNEPELAGRLKMRAIAMKQPELKGQNKMNFGTAKAGGEFEEAVVVPKGALPLRGTMVGFWVNPKSELMKDPSIMNDPRRLDMVRPNQFTKATQTQGVAEGAEEINWIKPNFDYEWDEIEFQSKQPQVPADVRNYMAKHFPDKQAWMKSVQYGRPVVMRPDHGQKIRNYTDNKRDLLNALSPASHDPQGPAKAKRVNALFDKGGPIEMPIILQTEKGLWLIGGKTRLGTANLLKGIPAKVWIIGGKQGVAEVSKTTVVENADQAAVDALLKKHGWSTGITGYGDLYFTWQGSTYVFYGDRMRINWPNGKSVSVVWGQKPDWQTRPGELSFAQAVQQKLLTFDLPIWQQLDRGQINDSQALQKFKTENERQAREAIAQGVTESAGPVEAYGYVYDRRDQRVMWRKVFPSEQAAQTWADSKNATVLGMKPVSQNIAEDYIDEKN